MSRSLRTFWAVGVALLLVGCATRPLPPKPAAQAPLTALAPTSSTIESAPESAVESAPDLAAADEPDVEAENAAASPPPLPLIAEPQQSFRQALQDPHCTAVTDRELQPFNREHVRRVLRLRGDMFNYVLREVLKRDLPSEFAIMPIIESGFRADPGNRGDVRGMWQFSAATARRFGLKTSAAIDERLSAIRATDAALNHLGDMWQRWADWRLAVIGYNSGEYAVTQALRRHRGGQPEWERLGLSNRSKGYARLAHALACFVATDIEIDTVLREHAAHPLDEAGALTGAYSAAELAGHLQVSSELLVQLNPWLRLAAPAAQAGQPLLIPASALPRFAALPPPAPKTASVLHTAADAATAYRVRKGDSLWSIARRHGVSVSDLLRWNAMDAKVPLQIGQLLRLAP